MSLFYHGKQLFELRYKGFLHVILGEAFGMPVDAVSVKATTEEHLGFTGEGLGIAAHAVALIEAV